MDAGGARGTDGGFTADAAGSDPATTHLTTASCTEDHDTYGVPGQPDPDTSCTQALVSKPHQYTCGSPQSPSGPPEDGCRTTNLPNVFCCPDALCYNYDHDELCTGGQKLYKCPDGVTPGSSTGCTDASGMTSWARTYCCP